MKFLILSKPLGQPGRPRLSAAEARAGRACLTKLMNDGVIDRAFSLEGGGSAYILNAPSQSHISQAVREHRFSLCSEIEILPLKEFRPEKT